MSDSPRLVPLTEEGASELERELLRAGHSDGPSEEVCRRLTTAVLGTASVTAIAAGGSAKAASTPILQNPSRNIA